MTRLQAPNRRTLVLASAISLLGMCLSVCEAQAMSLEQMTTLAGAALLDLRADALFRQCGLPSAIADTTTVEQPAKTIHWGETEMQLSPMDWELIYSRQRPAPNPKAGWINPGNAGAGCLPGLSGLRLHAKGQAGMLSVRKRADGDGYLTSYDVPDSLYAAHLVIGITGIWKAGVPISKIEKRYGKPDEVVEGGNGSKRYRYWVVARQKDMPVSVHAVDFEITGTEKICTRYIVRTNGFEFVQQKFDALQREWEKNYVLD